MRVEHSDTVSGQGAKIGQRYNADCHLHHDQMLTSSRGRDETFAVQSAAVAPAKARTVARHSSYIPSQTQSDQ